MAYKYSTQAKTAGHKLQKATRKHGTVVHVYRKPQPHTGVEGYFPGLEVTYNPYKYNSFVYKDNERPYSTSQVAYMAHKKVHVI